MRADLTRMREELASGRLSAPPASPSAPLPGAPDATRNLPRFPNMEVRDGELRLPVHSLRTILRRNT